MSHEFTLSFNSVSSNRNSWRFGVHISAFPTISTGADFSLFISVILTGTWKERNRTLVLPTCSYSDILGCLSKTKENQAEKDKKERGRREREHSEEGKIFLCSPLHNCR
jgi:hypothetical protein